MPGKKKTPDDVAQAVALREAGYTLPTIASRLNLSVSTTQRILRANKVVAGTSTNALIERVKEEMLNSAFSLEEIQYTLAATVLDDLALTKQIRMKLSESVEQLDPSNPIAFRALAAAATALKLTQDVTRRTLPIDKLNQVQEIEELPELQIRIMTEHDVAEMRAKQRLEEAEMNGDVAGAEQETENLRWIEQRRSTRPILAPQDDIICEGFD
jgi:hypothetical protein